jgi:hypothetical protein
MLSASENITITVTSPSGGGGGGFLGGGGSGAGGAPSSTPDATSVVVDDSVFNQRTEVKSEDGKAEAVIDQGTRGLTEDGKAFNNISIIAAQSPAAPDQSVIIGTPYDIGPDGATFDRPINLTFNYDRSLIPPGVDENNLVVATWDAVSGRWLDLASTVNPQNSTISAKTTHFSMYCVLAHTRPAAFSITDLSLQPVGIDVNGSVSVSALISNSGDLASSYTVTLKMDGADIGTQAVSLAGRSHRRITFSIAPDTSGTHVLSIDDLSAKLNVNEPAKAVFVVTGINSSANEVNTGETVTLGALVTNTGNLSGTEDVILKINGDVAGEKQVNLDAGANQEVNFAVLEQNPGSYTADINGLTLSFLVKDTSQAAAISTVPAMTSYSGNPAVPLAVKDATPTATTSSGPAANQFSLALLAEVIGGAFILIAATVSVILLRRRHLLRMDKN